MPDADPITFKAILHGISRDPDGYGEIHLKLGSTQRSALAQMMVLPHVFVKVTIVSQDENGGDEVISL